MAENQMTHDVAVTPTGTGPTFDSARERVMMWFERTCANPATTPLFTTNATGLWEAYLEAFDDPDVRQQHNCHACRKFIETYGGLAVVGEDGLITSPFWTPDAESHLYFDGVQRMARLVRRATITGVFYASAPVWGTPVTGDWRHFAVTPPKGYIFRKAGETAFQAMAAKREDFATVMRALSEVTLEALDKAVELLKTDALYRSEKVLGQATWLRDCKAIDQDVNRKNLLWRAVATAPEGFCHPRSSMIGTLLEDLAAGMTFETVARRFAEKMHPLQYQRPQAAPAAGQIAAAEKLVAELGLERSFARRYARLEDLQTVWTPRAELKAPSAGGMFAHLKPKAPAPAVVAKTPAQTMTWEKFARTVLPEAEEIEIVAPRNSGGYSSFTTAVHPDAPPILQWDSLERRNPVAWYFWAFASTAVQFGLTPRVYHRVTAITLKPSMWQPGFEHHGHGVMFVIAGAKDSRNGHLALFPETLRSELRGIRSVVEAYAMRGELEGAAEASAAGLMFDDKKGWEAQLRVRAGGSWLEYKLDRWD